jgi:hypothetical protein
MSIGPGHYLSKAGCGRLTLTSGIGGSLAWFDGSLDYQADGNVTLTGGAGGPGTLIKGGTGVMTIGRYVAFSNTGGFVVRRGLLQVVDAGQACALWGCGPFEVDSGARFWNNSDATMTGYAFQGGGLLVFNADVAGGGAKRTLTAQGGSLGPGLGAGGVDRLTLEGNLTVAPAGTGIHTALAIDVVAGHAPAAPARPGLDYDQLVVTGTVSGLAALDLSITIAPGRNYIGDVMTVLTAYNVLSGGLNRVSFNKTGYATVAVGGAPGAGGWITLARIAYAGDANQDGVCDMTDYTTWFGHYTKTSEVSWSTSDFDGSGVVDMSDYTTWFSHFSQDQKNFTSGGPVPEPGALALLAPACSAFAIPRRRRAAHA